MSRTLGWQTGAFTTRKPGRQAFTEEEGPPEPAEQAATRARLAGLRAVAADGTKINANALLMAGLYTPEICAEFHVRYNPKLCPHCWTDWCGGCNGP